MTKALEKVFREASKLPEAEQDALADAIRAELSTARPHDVMEHLAEEALSEYRSGRTQPIDTRKR